MPLRYGIPFICVLLSWSLGAQLPVARDTITVFDNGRVLKHAWAGGLNSVNVSNIDLNGDQGADLVIFDKQNTYGFGRFRCFIKTGQAGQISYRNDPGLSYFFPEAVFWAVFHDYNNDGKADLFCSTNGGIRVYTNTTPTNGLPSFSLASPRLSSNYYPNTTPPSISNLFASSAGVPGIADVDNDGDIDIMTFQPGGTYLELHRNMSMELYGHTDSLVYEREDDCWGNLAESSCEVNFEICGSRLAGPTKTYHEGSCIACLDNDGDLDQDLVMGDQSCNYVHYVHNTGSYTLAQFSDTTRLYPNFPAKNTNGTYIRMNYFPCAYVADVNGDGKKDLLASPNAIGSENFNSLWLYLNATTTPSANFQLQKKNFLQDEMIDVGQNSYPVFFDENSDGKKDLLVGTWGYFAPGFLDARLALFRNIGSATAPVFSLVTRDYANLGANSLNNIMPAVGDPDKDGDIDILIGTASGQVHWLENTAGAAMPCQFAPIKMNPFGFTTISSSAAPQLFDLDKDGKQDLLIGMKNGRIAFYKNTTTGATVSFSLITSFLGGVDVKSDPGRYGLEGYAAPFFYTEGGATYLLVGTVTGDVKQFAVGNLNANFQELAFRVNGLSEGSQATPYYEDINGDNKRDYIVGMATGGLSFFSSASQYVGLEELSPAGQTKLLVFPNPASEKLTLQADDVFSTGDLRVYDIAGYLVVDQKWVPGTSLDVSAFSKGVFIIELKNGNTVRRAKFIKEQ